MASWLSFLTNLEVFLIIAGLAVIILLLLLIIERRRIEKELQLYNIKVGPTPSAPKEEQVQSRKNRLGATSGRLFSGFRNIFASGPTERELVFRELEKSLIEGDVGVVATEKLLEDLRAATDRKELSLQTLESELKSRMRQVFDDKDGAKLGISFKPTVLVLVGINGVGKTTTAGKLAQKYAQAGKKVLLGACDTFRAAAVSQLQIWGERSGVEVVFGSDTMKPSTVAYNACKRAEAEGADLLILDTAGRLHNKKNLMDELGGVLKIIAKELPGAPHEVILVVDSTSGQNALEQARSFNEICNLTGIIVTKLDGSPRGGMLFAIRSELGIPIRYIGLGEGIEDLELFGADRFLDELFG
jgi:fused signal recognition particle receptor